MQYSFEWDPVKAETNFQKHDVSFQRAAEIFLDPFALSLFDKKHSREEERWITLGKDSNNVLLIVVHTFQEVEKDRCAIRIISARKATKLEARQY
ncbi:MAG: BrnT family toxin [Bacteroidota bacterium]